MDLDQLRQQIDVLDTELTELFSRRMELARQVAQHKRDHGIAVLNKTREREILDKVGKQVGEPLDTYARMLFSVLFDLSRSYQTALIGGENELSRRIRDAAHRTDAQFPSRGAIACRDVDGTCAQTAANRLFDAPDIMFIRDFEGVFQAVEQGLCDFGMLPIDGTSGSVNGVYDLMRRHKFHIVRGVRLPGGDNCSRFICVARELAIYPGADRVSLLLTVEHAPGALCRMIARFAALGVNLTKLESRPIAGRDSEFLFHIDLEASIWSEGVVRLLGECSSSDEFFAFLGAYSEVQ